MLMNMDTYDRNLVLRTQSGDRGAFGILVRKYRHRVMQLSMRYTGNRADAEDAVQETFMKAYGAVNDFRGDAAFYSWLYRIAINSANTVLSIRARQSSLFTSDDGRDKADGTSPLSELDTPEDLALTEELCGAVNAAIEALPDEQRTAIGLYELRGLSYAQVAAAMSCPVGTVRSRVFRARDAIENRLRRIFDDGPGDARRRIRCSTGAGIARTVDPP